MAGQARQRPGATAVVAGVSGTKFLGSGDLAAGLTAGPVAAAPVTPPVVTLRPDHLGYVICTSGSTGEPKAVAVSHGSPACVIAEPSAGSGPGAPVRVREWNPLPYREGRRFHSLKS